MPPPPPLVRPQTREEPRYSAPVDIVAPALALRFEHVPRALPRGGSEAFGCLAGGGGVQGVDGSEGGAHAGGGGGVGQKAR